MDFPFRFLIGSLLFLATRTRPDILFAVNLLSQYNEAHTDQHVRLLKRLLSYVVNTNEKRICLTNAQSTKLYAYSDASWASDPNTRKGFGGFIVMLGGIPLSWHCKKQKSVSLSTMDAEYYALVDCIKEVKWLNNLVKVCGITKSMCSQPTVYIDNESAIHFAKNVIENRRSKHIKIRLFFVRDWYQKNYFEPLKVPGELNVADIFTKTLSPGKLQLMCQNVFM